MIPLALNEQQQAAVHEVTGPCLVLAGAGSGKTRVIIHKIHYLVRQCGYQPEHIVAVTFTNKAAKEMKTRLASAPGATGIRGVTLSTFHALGLEIIRKSHVQLQLKANFTLFDSQDQQALLKSLLEATPYAASHAIERVTAAITAWKRELILPEQALSAAKLPQEQQLAECYAQYQEYLRACSILDFEDLILLPTQLLQQDDQVREQWQQQIRYLLVDEYQDTNRSQYELVNLLVGQRQCFTVVGDDDQSIYAWRGAQPENLLRLSQDYPALRIIKLERNYRSTGRILKVANHLIAHNPHIVTKQLFSTVDYGDPIRVISAANELQEAERVVHEIITHRALYKGAYRDYAIFYRSNHQSRPFEQVLLRYRIPYQLSGGLSFFARSEIKDILAYLRLLTNPQDDSAFLRIVNIPKRQIGTVTLKKLGIWAQQRRVSLSVACEDLGLATQLSPHCLTRIRTFWQSMRQLAQQLADQPIATLESLVNTLGYAAWLREHLATPQAAHSRLNSIQELLSWFKALLVGDDVQEPLSLVQIIRRFTLQEQLDRGESGAHRDTVQLMTLHTAKGLEFPYVYLIGMEEGLLPHQNSLDQQQLEEERRLAYVGITRAQRELTCSYCQVRRRQGETLSVEPSRFLRELPMNDLHWPAYAATGSAEGQIDKGKVQIANLRAKFGLQKRS
ncbi:MAG: DNA helicase Rep [Candidatus Symbiodolus clandestinus]